MEKSFTYSANNLSAGLDMLGLKFHVPGDQDFAKGFEFLRSLAKKRNFEFLLTNLKNEKILKHKKYAVIKSKTSEVFLLGVVAPEVLVGEEKNYFESPLIALTKIMPELKKQGYNSLDSKQRLVVLSHSGLKSDYELAKKFPHIDWIIGSHDQSYTKAPLMEGNTKVVQVLSRNHYLGHISFDFADGKDQFELITVDEHLGKKLSPNPFNDFIISHKNKMRELQELEQSEMIIEKNDLPSFRPPSTCIECHVKQGEHWKQTSHALAYLTLIKNQEEKNLNCLSCHSLGLDNVRGYFKSQHLVNFKDPPMNEKNPLDDRLKLRSPVELSAFRKKYWQEIENTFKGIKAVRGLSKNENLKAANTWSEIDQKFKVIHNFSGVQCLNCHTQQVDHPFEDKKMVDKGIKAKCLKCHNSHQSPDWYQVKSSGLSGDLDEEKFKEVLREMACPN